MLTLTNPLIPCDLSWIYGVIFIFKIRVQCQKKKIMISGIMRHYWRKRPSLKAAVEEICAIEGGPVIH